MDNYFKYDVFINYSPLDKDSVQELALQLKTDGLRVWFDEWEIRPDDSIPTKIEQGLEQSRTMIFVMSVNTFTSGWRILERHTILFRDPTNQSRHFIPLLLDNTEITESLKKFAYIDWRQKSAKQYKRLVNACKPNIKVGKARNNLNKGVQGKILKGDSSSIRGMAVTPDGQRLISGFVDFTLRIWELSTGKCNIVLNGHEDSIYGVTVSPNSKYIVSGSYDETIRIWDLYLGDCLKVLEGHTGGVHGVAVSPDSQLIVSASVDQTVRIWEVESGKCITVLNDTHADKYKGSVYSVVVTPDGKYIISGSQDNKIRIWRLDTHECIDVLKGHSDSVYCLAVSPNGERLISGSRDNTIRVWSMESGKCLAKLEGHTSALNSVAVTPDGYLLVSASADQTIKVWDIDTGQCLVTFEGHSEAVNSVVVTPDGQRAASVSFDGTVRVWDFPKFSSIRYQELEARRYTNAKVLLVGESGVGKSGIALRLTEGRFEPTISTDAAWASQMKLPYEVNYFEVEREIWLWDFAGQADYRLIHQLFMDETALAVLVFNPQSENPFEGLGQWDSALHRSARRWDIKLQRFVPRPFSKILVAGRCDRGGLMVSHNSIQQFLEERGFVQYLETSALTNKGCKELKEMIVNNIPWDDIPWTTSPRIFKLLKEKLIKLKDEGKVLLRMSELKQQLEMRLPKDRFTLEELRAVVGLLVSPGVVWHLGFGDFILLQPERINAYAAAVIRKVRTHTEEIGCIIEEQVLTGQLDYQDMERLPWDEEQIILRAMHQTFVERGLCLRENSEAGSLLVFPSYFKRERPKLEDHPSILVTYKFSGELDEIYATLVVRLHHTSAFEKTQLWRFAADFKTQEGKRVGLKMTKKEEGAAEITVYFDPGIPDDTKVTFIRYVHDHLISKDPDVIRVRHYVCPSCGSSVENIKSVQVRLSRGESDIICVICEERVSLIDLIEQKFASDEFQGRVRELEEQARIKIDNESRELILIGHAFAVAGEAGQIFRTTSNSDWGIDGEIEFKNDSGEASGKRVYLQLKSGDSYLHKRKRDSKDIFRVKKLRHLEYWQSQRYPVMLVIRSSDGQIHWMNVTDYLKKRKTKAISEKGIVFDGEPFTALNILKLRKILFT